MSATLAFALMLSPEAVPSAADLADAKCVVVLTAHGKHLEDEKLKLRFGGIMLFYVGKILGRSGESVVKAAVNASGDKLNATEEASPAKAASLAKQCAADAGSTINGI